MLGTLINTVAILLGTAIGLLVGNRLTDKIQETVMIGLGLVVLIIGIQNAQTTGNIVIPLLSIAIGAIIGEVIDLDSAFKRFGGWLQARVQAGEAVHGDVVQARIRFINGFVTATLVFCIGPLAIIGSMQNGMDAGDTRLLVIKSLLDFFASMAFAASLGIGVAFSAFSVFLVQGSFSLLGMAFLTILGGSGAGTLSASNPYIRELTATSGLLLLGLALILANVRQIRVANFLPALFIAPLLVLIAKLLGINIYPL